MKCAPFRAVSLRKHAVVGEDSDRVAHDPGKAGHKRWGIPFLELVKKAAVNYPGNDLP